MIYHLTTLAILLCTGAFGMKPSEIRTLKPVALRNYIKQCGGKPTTWDKAKLLELALTYASDPAAGASTSINQPESAGHLQPKQKKSSDAFDRGSNRDQTVQSAMSGLMISKGLKLYSGKLISGRSTNRMSRLV